MANFLKIRDIAEQKQITLRDIARKMDVTEGAIQKMITKGSTNTSTIELIAKILGVRVGIFFDEDNQTDKNQSNLVADPPATYGNSVQRQLEDKIKEIEHLKTLLDEKERTIQILMKK